MSDDKWQRVALERDLFRLVKILAAVEDRPINSVLREALTTGPVGDKIARGAADNKAA